MTSEKLFLRIYTNISEVVKHKKLSREYFYGYVLNNQSFGTKRVDDYTRRNIVNRIYKLGDILLNEKITKENGRSLAFFHIREIGRIIYHFILTEDIRRELFNHRNFGKPLVIENMDNLIPLELAFDGENFLSLLYPMGRSVPAHTKKSAYGHRREDKELFICVLSDPKEDLPDSKREGEEIAALFSKLKKSEATKITVHRYHGPQVTKDLVLFNILFNGRYDILHFSGHCEFDDNDPSLSALVLNDGPLKAYEIEEMKGSPIIFANACSSGLDNEKKGFLGRGLTEGLASNFVRYGAVAYIGSLWPVTEATASYFAKEFYRNLLDPKLALGEALMIAKRKMYKNKPNDLACLAYILFGDPSFGLFSHDEERMFMSSFLNEYAVYEIMRLEMEYDGLEMLTVNDPHWIFWNQTIIDRWVNNLTESEMEREKLLRSFDDYKKYFRKLALDGKKTFKIILNLKTFRKYLLSLSEKEVQETVFDIMAFLELENFMQLFYLGQEEEIEEYEIVSKNQDENENVNDNICVVIKESRIDRSKPYYFLFFNDTPELIIDHIKRYNDYKKRCLEQYRRNFSDRFSYLTQKPIEDYDEIEIKKVTRHILEKLLQPD